MKLVSLITLNMNQPAITEALLDSLIEVNTYKAIEIIVVDNASTINPVPGWIEKYPTVQFIRSEKNLGFTGGNNLGINYAKGEYLFVINNDTEVTENLISRLVYTLEQNPQIGVISPKINYYDKPDVLQYTGYTDMNYYTGRNKCIGQYEKDEGQYDYLTGKTGMPMEQRCWCGVRQWKKPACLVKTFLFIMKNWSGAKELKKQVTKYG